MNDKLQTALDALNTYAEKLDDSLTPRARYENGPDAAHPEDWSRDGNENLVEDYGTVCGIRLALRHIQNALRDEPHTWDSPEELLSGLEDYLSNFGFDEDED